LRALFGILFLGIGVFAFAQNKNTGNTININIRIDSSLNTNDENVKKRVLNNLKKDDERWENNSSFDMLALLKKNKETPESFHKMIQLNKEEIKSLQQRKLPLTYTNRIGYIPGITPNPYGYGFW